MDPVVRAALCTLGGRCQPVMVIYTSGITGYRAAGERAACLNTPSLRALIVAAAVPINPGETPCQLSKRHRPLRGEGRRMPAPQRPVGPPSRGRKSRWGAALLAGSPLGKRRPPAAEVPRVPRQPGLLAAGKAGPAVPPDPCCAVADGEDEGRGRA